MEALGIRPQFDTDTIPKDLQIFTMTEYKKEFPFTVLFSPEIPTNTLAEWLSKKGIPQFHCAGLYTHVVHLVLIFRERFGHETGIDQFKPNIKLVHHACKSVARLCVLVLPLSLCVAGRQKVCSESVKLQ